MTLTAGHIEIRAGMRTAPLICARVVVRPDGGQPDTSLDVAAQSGSEDNIKCLIVHGTHLDAADNPAMWCPRLYIFVHRASLCVLRKNSFC